MLREPRQTNSRGKVLKRRAVLVGPWSITFTTSGRYETSLSSFPPRSAHFLGIPTSFTDLTACRYPTCFQSVLVMTLGGEIRHWCVHYCRRMGTECRQVPERPRGCPSRAGTRVKYASVPHPRQAAPCNLSVLSLITVPGLTPSTGSV